MADGGKAYDQINRGSKHTDASAPGQGDGLKQEALELLAQGPPVSVSRDFSEAKPMDQKADSLWRAIEANQGSDLRLVREYRNWVGKSAVRRLTAPAEPGERQIKPSNNIVSNLCTLAKIDPKRADRAVPVAEPVDEKEPVYLNKDMQTCLLAYYAVDNPTESVPLGNGQTAFMIDLEIARRGGRNIEGQAAQMLNRSAVVGLENKVFGKNRPYDAAERKKIATRLGWSENEVEAAHKRLEEARS